MTNLLQKFEKEQINRLILNKRIPTFRPGDTVKVTVKIVEGDKSRLQAYEGMCIVSLNHRGRVVQLCSYEWGLQVTKASAALRAPECLSPADACVCHLDPEASGYVGPEGLEC